jgi:hypothetical protein
MNWASSEMTDFPPEFFALAPLVDAQPAPACPSMLQGLL